jgi:hypothetical protein
MGILNEKIGKMRNRKNLLQRRRNNFIIGCNHINRNHNKVCMLSFTHLEVVIQFGVESIRLFYIARFIIYHWNM